MENPISNGKPKNNKETVFPFLKKLSDKMYKDLKYFLEMPSNLIYEDEREVARYILNNAREKNAPTEQQIIDKFYGSEKKDREKWQKAKNRIQQTFLRYYTLCKLDEHPLKGIFLAEIYNEYGIKNKKNSEIKRQKKKLNNLLNNNKTLYEYWLSELEVEEHKSKREQHSALEVMEKKLDEFYVEKKFRCLLEKVNRIDIVGSSYEIEEEKVSDLLDWAKQKSKNTNSVKALIYYKLYTLLKKSSNNVTETNDIENLIEKNYDSIDKVALKEFYGSLFNYYIKKINIGQHQYAENYLICLFRLLDSGMVFPNKELPIKILKNSISIALINNDVNGAWALLELHQKKAAYGKGDGKLVLELMKATIFLYEEKYEKSFAVLDHYKLKDYYHDIDARLLKLQLDHSLQENQSSILQKIGTFKKVIRKHRKIPVSKRKIYLNFLEAWRQLIKDKRLDRAEFEGNIPKLKWRWLKKMEDDLRERK